MLILTILFLIRLIMADWSGTNLFTFVTGAAGGLLVAYWIMRWYQHD
ncbi:MAG: hypothetical protein ACRDBM_15385 [Sporomusa sp.]